GGGWRQRRRRQGGTTGLDEREDGHAQDELQGTATTKIHGAFILGLSREIRPRALVVRRPGFISRAEPWPPSRRPAGPSVRRRRSAPSEQRDRAVASAAARSATARARRRSPRTAPRDTATTPKHASFRRPARPGRTVCGAGIVNQRRFRDADVRRGVPGIAA